jgi:hypothetical protein
MGQNQSATTITHGSVDFYVFTSVWQSLNSL